MIQWNFENTYYFAMIVSALFGLGFYFLVVRKIEKRK
jgi:preprotein translocase subunit YajC